MSANLRILAGDSAEFLGNYRARFCQKIGKMQRKKLLVNFLVLKILIYNVVSKKIKFGQRASDSNKGLPQRCFFLNSKQMC